ILQRLWKDALLERWQAQFWMAGPILLDRKHARFSSGSARSNPCFRAASIWDWAAHPAPTPPPRRGVRRSPRRWGAAVRVALRARVYYAGAADLSIHLPTVATMRAAVRDSRRQRRRRGHRRGGAPAGDVRTRV